MADNILGADGADRHALDPEEEVVERGDDNNADDDPRRHDEVAPRRGQDDVAANLHRSLGDDNPGPMVLTEHERGLAINIKEAIAGAHGVDPVSDFMCAQLALIEGDNTEGAVERVRHLQYFREEYGILDTAEDGMKFFMDYVALFPKFHLCFTYSPEGGNYVMMYDDNKFRCGELGSDKSIRTFLGGCYYTCVAFCPDFDAIRAGCIVVAECEGYDWKRDFNFKSIKRAWSEVATAYPVHFERIKYLNASNAMTIVANMLKPFLPKHVRRRQEFGCQCEHRLDTIFMVPSVEVANFRLLYNLEESLNKRQKNEHTFRL